jgi:hypothetical protein
MHPFESLTAAQVEALSPAERSAYEAWFWRWLSQSTAQADFEFDVSTKRKEGWGYAQNH